jgi:maleate isomerase
LETTPVRPPGKGEATPLPEPTAWHPAPATLHARPWPIPSVGLIALAGDAVIEPELRGLLGRHANLHTTRVLLSSAVREGDLVALGEAIGTAAGLLLPGGRVAVVAFGCTSGAAALGSPAIRSIVTRARPDARVTDPLDASLAEFARRGVRSVAVVSPYADDVNARLVAYLSDHGVRVPDGATLRAGDISRVLGRTPPNLVAPSSILEAVVGLGRSRADAVFIACTGLRCTRILGEAEERLRRPVIGSNQALAAHVLRLAEAGP